MATNNHLQSLFEKYMSNTCTKEEWNELLQLVREETHEDDLQQAFQSYWNSLPSTSNNPAYWNQQFYQMMQQAKAVPQAPVVPLYRRKIFKYIAAAAIILLIVGGWWMRESKRPGARGEKEVAQTHDVPAPTNTRAVITLADGSKVYLDSAGNGTIAQQNDVAVVKDANGGIQYLSPAGGGELSESPNSKRPGVDYNTLFNPRGSKVISLTLSDGTKVWLNAESSLRYPASFSAPSAVREVEITGEAYFEVAHNSKQPFKVHLPNGSIVEDIGTAFNINAYPDEDATKTTLIEGAVKISAPSADKNLRNQREKILKPGEQARLTANSQWLTTNPDLGEVMAWKNGRFVFNRTDVQTTMRQIARWYDVDIEYKGDVKGFFSGAISRLENASQVLKMLEMTGEVHFSIEGKKITVMQ